MVRFACIVYEIWLFFKKENIVNDKTNFSADILGHWNAIESFFSETKNESIFNFIRNKFGFHFDHYSDIESYIDKAMARVGDLEFWMGSDSSGNDIFSSSNVIILIILCDKMRELGFTGTDESLIDQLHKLPLNVSHSINEFCKGYFTNILLKDCSFNKKLKITATVPLLSEVTLPLIVKND